MSKRVTSSSEEEYQREIAKQAMEIKLKCKKTSEELMEQKVNQTAEFRKFNLQKFNNKIQHESGEFIITNYMVGKLVAFPDDKEIIDLTGSHEEQDDY